MRRHIVRVAVTTVAAALILFAVPLAIAVHGMLFSEERGELERAALEAVGRVAPQLATGATPLLPPTPEDDTDVGVYDVRLALRAGEGPATADATTRTAMRGSLADGQEGDLLVVAVPITSGDRLVGVSRAAMHTGQVWQRVWLAWLALVVAAAVALGVAVLVARRQARILSRPLEALSDAADQVAHGDLSIRAAPSRIPEIDRVADAQNTMVTRLARILERERQFSANASHQLRTPLTGLQLGLTNALDQAHGDSQVDLRPALEDAVTHVAILNRTIEEMLRLSRRPEESLGSALTPLGPVLAGLGLRWRGPLVTAGRRLEIRAGDEVSDATVPAAVVGHILDVLIDNALQHGRGVVSVSARDVAGALALDVSDEGTVTLDPVTIFQRGTSGGSGPGIGLALGRSLAESAGGRLRLSSAHPATFTVLIPAPDSSSAGDAS